MIQVTIAPVFSQYLCVLQQVMRIDQGYSDYAIWLTEFFWRSPDDQDIDYLPTTLREL